MDNPGHFLRIARKISGQPNDFSLTVRIFHSVLVISMAALIYNIPLNIYVGLISVAWLSVATLILVGFLYYLSRYLKKTTIARLIFCVIGNCLFITNFFLNSGIDGPTGYFFILMMVIIISIVPVKEYWYWVSSNIIIMIALHYIQYHHPLHVPNTYKALMDRYIDINSAYVTVILVSLACFYIMRRHYENERNEAQQSATKLLKLDAEKNKLFSIVSHDLRSPLAHIQNYLELLAEHELSDHEQRMINANLLHSTRNTLDMVNNVLSWSKNQMSGLQIEKKELDVAKLLKPQMQLYHNIASYKQIELISAFNAKATIWGNEDMVLIIARNLVNNAIKFTSSGGKIQITATISANKCLITVKDTGNGKPANITEDNFRLSGTSSVGTDNEKGIGLGLALCKEYTEALNGRIWCICGSKSGATFFVELPAVEY